MILTDRHWLRGLLLGVVYTLGLIGIVASGGGGGGGGDDDDSTTIGPKTVTGGGVKGPLANAIVTVYAFDPIQPGFKGAVIAAANTDATAAIVGLTIPNSATPPLIIEFTSDAGTTDITTGMAPVVPTMRSVITQAMLDSGEQVYATPLTTMGVDIAIENSVPTPTGAQFEAALAAAATQVVSTLGFGLPGDLDIYRTPPLVNNGTVTIDQQADVAAYRSAVEAMSAIVYAIDQQSSGDANAALLELSLDLADGEMDGIINGVLSTVFSSTALDILSQDPSMLVIPNTAPPRTVADVQNILVTETAITGTTGSTASLDNGSITTIIRRAARRVDTDGDGTPNSADAFPQNPNETVDSDGDGLGDNADPDDDNDGVLDEDEGMTPAPGPDDDDGDGIDNIADNCPLTFNPAQTNTDGQPDGGDACDDDDDNDGTPDASDAFPRDAGEQRDADGDGIGDVADPDDDNDGLPDDVEDGAPPDPDGDGIPNREDIDSDNDGALDNVDFAPYDPNVGINQAPVVADSSVTTDEDVAVMFTLDVSDDGVTGGALTFDITPPANGTLDRRLAPILTYTPSPQFSGSDSLSFTVRDTGLKTSPIATVSITVNPVNDDPVIDQTGPLDVTMDEDGTPIGFVAPAVSASDVEGDPLSWSGSAAGNGVATVSGTGASPTIGYAPNSNFFGDDSFDVTVSDGNGGSDTITVDVTVEPVNDAPVIAQGDAVGVTMDEDGAPTAFVPPVVTANDIDSVALNWSGTAASNGVASVSGAGASPTITYSPNAGYSGPDSFDAIVNDGDGGSDSITINVTVNPVNDAPVIDQAGPLEVTMDEDGAPTGFVAPAVSASDADGDPLTWSGGVASNGTANVSGSGASPTIDYTPDANFFGGDSFDVTVSDGIDSDTITINVTVDPVNDDPVAVDDVAVTLKNNAVTTGNVLLNDTDVDGDVLSVAAGDPAAANGTVVNNNDGTFTYTPNADYSGPDSFEYTVNDGNGGSDIGTVNITVNADTGPAIWNQFNWNEGTWQ